MHNESLTRRDLLGRLDFLEGALGFGSGILRALVGLGKFGLLNLRITLQGLVLFDGVLELLLDLADKGSCFSRAARSLAALSSASANTFLRAATSVAAPNKVHDTSVSMNFSSFLNIKHRLVHTLAVLQLLLHMAELFLGPLQILLQTRDLHSMSGSNQQRRLLIHIDMLC